jgi:hypothetical protein
MLTNVSNPTSDTAPAYISRDMSTDANDTRRLFTERTWGGEVEDRDRFLGGPSHSPFCKLKFGQSEAKGKHLSLDLLRHCSTTTRQGSELERV